MKNGLLLICFCLSFSVVSGQKSNVKRYLKTYINASYDDQIVIQDFPDIFQIKTTTESNLSVGRFSPAISFSKGKYYLEAEISKLLFGIKDDVEIVEFVGQDIFDPTEGELKTSFDIALRAETGIDLFPKSTLIRPILSVGIQPYVSTSQVNSENPLIYTIHQTIGGTDLQFIPRFQLFSDKKLFVDFNMIFSIVNFGQSYYRVADPGLTIDEQIDSTFYARFFSERFGARLGVGYRI